MARDAETFPVPGAGSAATERFGIPQIVETVSRALGIVLERAQRDEDHVRDQKDPDEGPLQDAEFGMILLATLAWLRRRTQLSGPLANEQAVGDTVLVILKRLLGRVLGLRGSGASEDQRGKPKVYFTTAPYAFETVRGRQRFYDNSDAAALMLSFLIRAADTYWSKLEGTPHGLAGNVPRNAGGNLLSASLYVVHHALEYLSECAVTEEGACVGWDCRPGVVRTDDERHDRLFFTWTVSETIEDLKPFRDRLLAKVDLGDTGRDIAKKIGELVDRRTEAGSWCKRTFSTELLEQNPTDVAALLEDENQWYDNAEVIGPYVRNVYHLSQYGSILSLTPAVLDLDTVDRVCAALDEMVRTQIIESGLDDIKPKGEDDTGGQKVFETLTRQYKVMVPAPYYDDAWYPLVVRSMSALLARSIEELERDPAVSRESVLSMLDRYGRALQYHVGKLASRHPEGEEDEHLWACAPGTAYVFYATERTIFALTQYGTFLEAAQQFMGEDGGIRDKISKVLGSGRILDLLLPAIAQIVEEVGSAGLPEYGSLPDWAKGILGDWIEKLAREFNQERVAQKTRELLRLWFAVSERSKERAMKGTTAGRVLQKHVETVGGLEGIGDALIQASAENEDELVREVFRYAFEQFLRAENDSTSLKSLFQTDVWKTMAGSRRTLQSAKAADH